jgi:hypothetical protein
MSRGQSTQAFNTASDENATDFGNAQSAFGSTENAIGNYNNQLAKFVSGSPYTPGGEYDQTINTGLANVSNAGANSLAGALQSQARQNTRDLSGDLAQAQQQRIAAQAGYNQAALGASAQPIGANQALYGTSSNAADSVLGDENQAAKTPSFWDEVGNSVAGNLGGNAGKL